MGQRWGAEEPVWSDDLRMEERAFAVPLAADESGDDLSVEVLVRVRPLLPSRSAWADVSAYAPTLTAILSIEESTALNCHVSTTSTAAVYIREHGRYRIYVQSPALVDSGTGQNSFPTSNPALPGYRHLPTGTDWQASGRFERTKIGFIDSCDGGYSFPVYAPAVSYVDEGGAGSCRFTWDSADFSQAGWTSTAIPCASSEDVDGDGIYLLYNEVSVIDLYEEHGLYLMICIECRSREPSADGGCSGCIFPTADSGCATGCEDLHLADPWGSADTPYSTGFTRIVMFVSDSPDFPEGAVYPAPGYSDAAMVLVQPDIAGTGPSSDNVNDCPNEQYGVHHALLTPDRETLLLYVPWNARPDQGPNTRVTDHYADAVYPHNLKYLGQALWEINSGISCFAIDVDVLMTAVRAEWDAFVASGDAAAEPANDFMELVGDYYQGELLISDGSENTDDPGRAVFGLLIPTMAPNTDPQFAFHASGDLWVYYDVGHCYVPEEAEPVCDQDTLWRARLVGSSEFATYSDALSRNGAYTVFKVESCGQLADLRELVDPGTYDSSATPDQGWAASRWGRLIGDPDPTYLRLDYSSAVRARVLFSGGSSTPNGEPFAGGLLYVVGPWEHWEELGIDQWDWAAGLAEASIPRWFG